MGELVDDVEHAVPPAIMGAVLDEVVRPDVIGMLRPQTNAGAIGKPQPPAFRLLPRDLQPLASPDPLDPRVADQPAGIAQQRSDLAVAIAAVRTAAMATARSLRCCAMPAGWSATRGSSGSGDARG